jgi:hypothetical protein
VSWWIIVLGLYLGRRLNGLTSGVVTVIKGCLLRPLQERWTQNKLDKDFCASAFDFVSFEPRYLNSSKTDCDLVNLFWHVCGLLFCQFARDCALYAFRAFYEHFGIYSAAENSVFFFLC